MLYESIEIATGIRIGYVNQPNILVPLLVCNVARSEYIMSKLTRYFCKRKSFLKKAYSKARVTSLEQLSVAEFSGE